MNKRWLTSEALRNSFKDLTGHASTTFLCAAVLGLPVLLSATISAAGAPILGGLLTFFSMFFVAGWLPYAITLATKQYAIGEDPGPGGLLDQSASKRIFSYLWTQLLFTLLLAGFLLLALVPIIGFGVFGFMKGSFGSGMPLTPETGIMGIFTIILLLPLVIGLILFVYLRYGLVTQVNALEGTSPSKAFGRSRELLRGRKMDFFVLLLIVFVLNAVISLILSGPGMVVSIAGVDRPRASGGFLFSPFEMMGRRDSLPPLAALLVGVSSYLSSVVGVAFMATTMTNYYLSARGEEALEEASVAEEEASVAGEGDLDPPPPLQTDQTGPDPGEQ